MPSPRPRRSTSRPVLAELGNARRIAGDLRGAAAAFDEAHRRLRGRTEDLRLYGEVLKLHGWLLAGGGSWAEAAEMLAMAEGLFLKAGAPEARGRALVARGIALGELGEDAAALGSVVRGLERLDLEAARGVVVEAVAFLALSLVELGRRSRARALATIVGRLDGGGRPAGEALRRRWLEGEMAAALREYLPAARALREARSGLQSRGGRSRRSRSACARPS